MVDRFPTAVTSDICITQDTNHSADMKSLRVMGSFRKRKKTPTTELNIFLSEKNFSTENNK